MPPPVVSSARALARLLSGSGRVLDPRLVSSSSSWSTSRCFSSRNNSVARIGNPRVDPSSVGRGSGQSAAALNCNTRTTRWFLGVGDGEEGDVLSKVYEERRVMGYSQEQLFAVVAAVDLYEDFVPWCQRSQILRKNSDGSFDAELEIGFKFLVESYVSHVEMKKPTYIKTTASESGLFDHLINIWEFNPGPVPGSCDLYFLVDFKFQSPLYRQVASVFFKEVVARLVGSFNDRCRRIYGPGVQVLENAYGHGR
ncbi:coenzyme Q-binding protein COQ10-like protein, mitochondrial-like [Iris pallida]|uniref:Coenzyme Q-binding protein COQ10-like protein, mitochondrial-like n=1 Tax=Iris pallida TaxID=29817 RepID=A0AAX6E713_IRIPA|nr:coenzyme Q-binding protein COQ10-like protein, mitochondrial-like [Iris pallida]KAJ6799857.1 coenzyme Q-binding protein COQ10-like protein, mitochondrial-like [Iris pallida]